MTAFGYDRHLVGLRHKARLDELKNGTSGSVQAILAAKAEDIESRRVHRCDLCGLGPMTDLSFAQHLAGARHQRRLAETSGGGGGGGGGDMAQDPRRHPLSIAEIEAKLEANPKKQVDRCDACQTGPMTTFNYMQHLTGVRHRQRVEEIEELEATTTTKKKKKAELEANKQPVPLMELNVSSSSSKSEPVPLMNINVSSSSSSKEPVSLMAIEIKEKPRSLTNTSFFRQVPAGMRCELCECTLVNIELFTAHLTSRQHQDNLMAHVAQEAVKSNQQLIDTLASEPTSFASSFQVETPKSDTLMQRGVVAAAASPHQMTTSKAARTRCESCKRNVPADLFETHLLEPGHLSKLSSEAAEQEREQSKNKQANKM
jgi:hypothetical protein